MANNVLINIQGLLDGKRVRRLTLKARLYYPLLLGIANTFARLELDYDLLADKLVSFRDPDAAASNIAEWFHEYEKNKLVFLYDGHNADAEEPTRWAQFDTPTEFRRSFPSKEDNDSPEPPEPAYTEWLKAVHGSDWERFHLSNYQRDRQSEIGAKRAAAGRKGAAKTNAKRWGANGDSQQNQQTDFADSPNRQSRLVEVVVEDEGEDDGEGEDSTESYNLKSRAVSNPLEASSRESGTGTTKTQVPAKTNGNGNIPIPTYEKVPSRITTVSAEPELTDDDLDRIAGDLTHHWHAVMEENEKFDFAKLPYDWEKVWKIWFDDFRKLLDVYSPETIDELMAYSQSDSQQEYNFVCKTFCNNCERNIKFMEAMKKTSKWKPVWERHQRVIAHYTAWLREQSSMSSSLEKEDENHSLSNLPEQLVSAAPAS